MFSLPEASFQGMKLPSAVKISARKMDFFMPQKDGEIEELLIVIHVL